MATVDVRLVVVQFTSVTADVPSNVLTDLTQSFSIAIPAAGIQWTDDLWAGTAPLILVRDSLPGIPIQAFTTPSATDPDLTNFIAFDVRRAGDDNTGIGGAADLPTLEWATGLGGITLAPDQAGSFQVLAFIDTNQNGIWDVGETGVSLPLVLVEAVLNQNESSSPYPDVTYQKINENGAWVQSNFYGGLTSLCPQTGTQNCAVDLKADVDLIGGGPSGLRGVSQVFVGWVQNEAAPNVVGYYQNNHLDTWVFASNIAQTAEYQQNRDAKIFMSGDPDPQIIGPPLIDTKRPLPGSQPPEDQQPGSGGDSSTMGNSTMTASSTQPQVGQRVVVEAMDATFGGLPAQHYSYPTSALTQISYNLTFSSYLAVWSSVAGVSGGTGVLADRTYGIILQQPWTIVSGFAIDASGNSTPPVLNAAVTLDPSAALVFNPLAPATVPGAVLTLPKAGDVTADNAKH